MAIDLTKDPRFQQFMDRVGLALQESMKDKLTPEYGKDTGNLKAGIIFKKNGNEITFEMPYHGAYLEFGTPPHVIRAKDAEALHWKTESGEDVFAKEVHHPGTRPYPFIRTTMRKELLPIIEDALEKSFK